MPCFRRRTTGLILLLQVVALPALGQGKGHGVEVRAPAETQLSARAAEVISTPFVVTNRTADPQELVETLTLPPGWQIVLPLSGFRLDAGASETRLVVCRVAPGVAGGTYDLTYEVSSRRDPAISDAQSLQVVIASFSQLALQAESPPARLVAGRAVSVTVRVANEGNVPLQASLTAASAGGLAPKLSPAKLSLEPRASAAVTMSLRVPDLRRSGVRIVTITATGSPPSGKPVQATLTLPFTVLPRTTALPSLDHTLPVELTMSAVGDGRGAGWQMELSGRGTLDEAGKRQLDFRFRGPDATGHGFFGARDEYTLTYSDPALDVHVGDQLFGLSDLTDRSLYARGLGVTQRPGHGTEWGLWRATPRWSDPAGAATGAFVRHDFSSRARVRLNWLEREGRTDGGPGGDDLWSVQADLRPLPEASLGLEYARDEAQSGGSDEAWRVRGNGRIGHVADWSFNHISAGPDYRGYYRDCRATTATVSARISPQLRLQYAFNRWLTNLHREPTDNDPSTDELLHRMSLQWSPTRQWGVTVGMDQLDFRDTAALERTDFSSQRLWTAVTHSTPRSSVRVEVRHEARDDRATASKQNMLEGRVYASYTPSDALALSLYGGWRDGRARGRPDPLTGSNDYGAAVAWKPSDDTQVRGWIAQYRSTRANTSTTTASGLSVEHHDRAGRKLALEVRSGDGAGRGRQTDYLLSYTVPIGVRVGRKRSVGAVSGRLRDQAGAPIADAVVMLDEDTVVSDSQGRFGFGEVKPGNHALSVDAGTLGGRLLDRDPGPVHVDGGKTTSLELRAVAAARLTGAVKIAAPAPEGDGAVVGDPGRADLANGAGVPNLVVEMTREADKPRRQSTDGLGRFAFESLRPGDWHLKVYPTNLPQLHKLEQPEQDLTIQGGERREVTIPVTPIARQMRMLRPTVVPVATTTTVEDKPGSAPAPNPPEETSDGPEHPGS